jgi:outer membrane protein TolC
MRPALLLCLALTSTAARAQTAASPALAPAVPPMEAVDFDEAVRRAMARAPTARLAAEDVKRIEALLWETRASSLPLLTANASYLRIDAERDTQALVPAGPPTGNPPVFTSVTPITIRASPVQQNNANLSLSAPLFAPSRWYQWSHAGDQVDVARASERDVRRVVSLTAARAYLTIIAQKRAVEVSRRAVQTAAAHFDYAHTRRLGGVGNALDEARADQQLATSQAQLESAVAGLARAQEALGIAAGNDGPLDAKSEPDLGGGPPDAETGSEAAEQGRTDVLLSRKRYEAAHRVTRDSWADWLPTLSLNALAYRQIPASTVTPQHGWQVQLLLSLPLFEGGLRIGQARERSALEAQARTQLDATILQARSDVRTAFFTLQHADTALADSRRAAQQANVALTIVQQAFKAGATTSLDVTDAERTARDADSAAVVAEDAVRQARLDLLAATGKFPAP